MKYRKKKLKKHYDNGVLVSSITGMSSIIIFHDSTLKLIHEQQLTNKVIDASNELEQGLDMASPIILNDIWLRVYNCDEYQTMEETESRNTLIPDSLMRFMHNLWTRKVEFPQ